MGGCRCSYRSCNVRSDGQTHMFHFPVFDKMRCHQWVSNAHKPEFFNLKLSQLKNRVICQHHFKHEHFMNFLSDKLKSTAIPTEDGPYCTSNHKQSMVSQEPDYPVIPINPEDIEHDMLNSLEKKAHFSVKYGDYLTSDVTEMFNSSQPNISEIQDYTSRTAKSDNRGDSYYELTNKIDNNKYTINYDEMLDSRNILYSKKIKPTSSVVSIEFEDQLKQEASQSQEGSLNAAKYNNFNPDKMIKIISEQPFSEPLKVVGKLQPVPASMIVLKRPIRMLKSQQESKKLEQSECKIEPQHKQENSFTKPIDDKSQVLELDSSTCVYQGETVPIEFIPPQNTVLYQNRLENQPQIIDISSIKKYNNQENVTSKENDPSQLGQVLLNCVLQEAEDSQKYGTQVDRNLKKVTTSKKTLLKNRVTPEKLAAIEQKRKFNMKLRDVITSCLNNLDEQNENENIPQVKKQANMKIMFEEPTNPSSSQSNVIDYLESRLQKMEDTLLNKIENNTNRINQLKRTVKPTSCNKKSVNTQTYINHMTERSQKEYLYKEISKFLSPSANIKIYEELFLKPDVEDIEEPKPRKLRKRR